MKLTKEQEELSPPILHRLCENQKCVRPSHMKPLRGRREHARYHPSTSRRMLSIRKLTDAEANQIRMRYVRGGISQRQLADVYGVNRGSVYAILKGLATLTDETRALREALLALCNYAKGGFYRKA